MITTRSATAIVVAMLAGACASTPKEPLDRVCVSVNGLAPHEQDLVLKKAGEYLREYGFKPSQSNCQADVRYQVFGGSGATLIGGSLLVPATRAVWSQEGTVTVTKGGATVIDDERIDLNGYSRNTDMLEGLAWAIVKPITKMYRPSGS